MNDYKSTIKNLWSDKKSRTFILIIALFLIISIVLIAANIGTQNSLSDESKQTSAPGFSLIDHKVFYTAGFAAPAISEMTDYLANYFQKNYPSITNADLDEETYLVAKKNNYEEYTATLHTFDKDSNFVADFRLTIHAYSYKNLDYSLEKIDAITE